MIGDFDGDGRADQFIVYAHPLAPDGTAQAWHVLLITAYGKPYFRDLDMWPGSDNKGAVAALDASRDGRAQALVLVHQGAADDVARLFELWDTRILQVRGPGGEPFEFDTGGSNLEGSGGGCRQAGGRPVLYRSGYFERAHRWHWTQTSYGWDGDRGLHVTPLHTRGGVTTERRAERFGQFACYSLHLGGSTRPKVAF